MTEIKEKKTRKPKAKKTVITEQQNFDSDYNGQELKRIAEERIETDVKALKQAAQIVSPLEVQTAVILPVKEVFKSQEESILQVISAEIEKEKRNRNN